MALPLLCKKVASLSCRPAGGVGGWEGGTQRGTAAAASACSTAWRAAGLSASEQLLPSCPARAACVCLLLLQLGGWPP
jgi:hypothetical protein